MLIFGREMKNTKKFVSNIPPQSFAKAVELNYSTDTIFLKTNHALEKNFEKKGKISQSFSQKKINPIHFYNICFEKLNFFR